ncbi:MAG: aminoglycoside phosphotransferase family protein [Alphaproteobacteria bacterium]|nr:aminoglycoside phosphotransferase family protein [Alphaproteobacteria bacterium]
MDDADPTPEHARDIAAAVVGRSPRAVRRFTTGARHFVYEVVFERAPPVVVRMTRPAERRICRDAAALSGQLRPLGVPLPELLADGSESVIPHLVLERLPGRDFGQVARSLDRVALERIAHGVADAQSVVARLPSTGRYGYGAKPEAAPHARWSAVLEESLERSRRRIATAGLFDLAPVERVGAWLERLRPELDAVPATPFLHDTTTKNVIVTDDGRLSGVVDVDDLCYGDPRHVAALTLASLLGGMARGGPVEYVELWRRRAGWREDALFRFYVAFCLADFMSEHGQRFNGNTTPSTHEDRAQLMRAFEAAAAAIG